MIMSDDYGSGLYDGGGIIEDGDGYGYGFDSGNAYGSDGCGFGLDEGGFRNGDGHGHNYSYDASYRDFVSYHGNGICHSGFADSIVAILKEEEKP